MIESTWGAALGRLNSLAAFLLAIFFAVTVETSAAQTAPPLDSYGDLPNVEDMSMSPSGEFLAVAGKIEGDRRVVILDAERQLRAAHNIGDIKFDSVTWAGEEFAIVRLRDTVKLSYDFTASKAELSSAAIIPTDGGDVKGAFGDTPAIANLVMGYYGTRLIDGEWYGYFGGLKYRRVSKLGYAFDHGRPSLFSVNLEKNRPDQVAAAAPEGYSRDWLLDEKGHVAAILQISSQTGKWEIRNERSQEIASGLQQTGNISLLSFGGDGSSVIYEFEDADQEAVHWMEVPLAGGAPNEILTDVDVRRFYVDRTNGRLMGYLPDGSDKAVLFDPEKQAILNKVYRAFPAVQTSVVEWTPSFSRFLVHTSGNGDSGTWYLVDIGQLKADPIGYDRPLVGPNDVGPISIVEYTATDGLGMDGVLTLPPGREPKNLPVIMFPHGGPSSHDEAKFDWWAQAFASRGYAVFQPNFRGSTNRDVAFRRAGFGEWGRKMQSDISDGLAALAERGIVDPSRACIMGASYGGYAALAGVTLQQGLYKCAVAVAPVSDVKLMYDTDRREANDIKVLKRSLIEALGDPHNYNDISPRRFADRADAPILLIHGKDDTRVPFKQSRLMADALDDAGKPYEFVVLDEEDHFLSRPSTRKQMLETAMRFVQKYNPANRNIEVGVVRDAEHDR